MKHRTFWLVVLVLTSMQLIAGNNDLLWDYSSAAPRSNPDNGLYYESRVTQEGFYGVKLNRTGYAYFSKAAVAGTLTLVISPRQSGASVGVKIYTWSGTTPSAETLIKTSETITSPGMISTPLTAEQNNIYIVRSTGSEATLQVIRFTEGDGSSTSEPPTGGGDQPSENVFANGTCGNIGNNVTWALSHDGTLTISGSGMMEYYSNANATPWSSNRASINKVVISENVTSIGSYAFAQCVNLTSVEIANSVTSIGGMAFSGCTGLTSVTIPNSIRTIGNYAFDGCVNLKTVYNNSDLALQSGSEEYGYIAYYVTSIVQDGHAIYQKAPESVHSIYDTDGDGEMEFISGAVLYNKNGEKVGDLPTLGTNSSDYSYYHFANYNNSEFIGIVSWNYCYINVNNNYDVLPIDLSKSPIQLDANLDGRMDFYTIEDAGSSINPMGIHYFYLRQADGSYLKTQLTILTDTAAINSAMLELWESASNSGLAPMYWSTMPSVSDGWMHKMPKRNDKADDSLQPLMMHRATVATTLTYDDFTSIDTSIDLDRNGLLDLMSSTTGAVLYNLGNNRFLMGQFPGQVTVKDLNGDGIMDYIIYDATNKIVTLQIYEGDGLFKTQTLMQNMAISNVWCYDFDNDGDVDILLPFDYTKTSGYAYLVFFRNDGNNTFKKVENAFDDPNWHFEFIDCKDVDNDGYYEVVAVETIEEYSPERGGSMITKNYYLVRYNSRLKVSVDDTPFISDTQYYSTSELYFISGDFNNDGVQEYWTEFGWNYALSSFPASAPNTAPAKMPKPRTILDAQRQMLNISWDRGSDAESSALDLEYSIRIGSASGKSDIWFAAAGADGKQRSLWGGNVGTWLNQWVNVAGWAEGDYYIAVQAIDPNNLGGAWSDEVVYHHSLLSADFTLSVPELSTVDTLVVQYDGVVNPNCTYTWNFGDSAIILSQESQKYKLAYNTGGIKTISLQVTNAAGQTSPLVTKQVQIDAVRFDEAPGIARMTYLDMNGDGIMDGFGRYNDVDGFFTYKGNNEYKKIAKTYNTDLTISNWAGWSSLNYPKGLNVQDYNMDGLPDLVFPTNKGNVIINDGDLDVEFRNIRFLTISDFSSDSEGVLSPYNIAWNNIFNTGKLDYRELGGVHSYNSETDTTCIYEEIVPYWHYLYSKYSSCMYVDMDGDGLKDRVGNSIIELNNDDNNFLEKYACPSRGVIEDLNNDGYYDFCTWKNRKTLQIYLGDAEYNYSEIIEITLPGEFVSGTIKNLCDIDNNGYVDLYVYGSKKGYIIYMYPNWTVTIQNIDYGIYGNNNWIDDIEFYPFTDINNDGTPDISIGWGSDFFLNSRITNESPAAPTNLRVSQTEKGVLCSWDAGIDRETPAAQMKYNISIKKKNAQVGEDNAFIISPVNGLSDDAAIVPGYPYWRGTNFIVPITRFEVGQEYELQVQSIDLWGAHSPMSQVYTFRIENQVSISMPDEACKNDEVTVRYIGTETGTQQWNWDGGFANDNGNGVYQVSWTTGGVKTVTLTVNGLTTSRSIYVKDNDDNALSFSLPDAVLSDTWVEFLLPDAFKDPSAKIKMRTSSNIEDADCALVKDETGVHYSCLGKIQRLEGTLKARVRFKRSESIESGWIEFYQEDATCGEKNNYRATTQVMGYAPAPQISIVTVDAATGKNCVIWDAPANLPSYIDKIYVYKEEGSTNNWVRQAEIALSAGQWIDMASDPAVRKNRYKITYGTNFGAESNKSTAHSSTHLQMNVGLQGANNLIWTKYEGGTIDSYRILRGTTPDNMTVIATVPGTEYTYTDLNAPEGVYYALEYDNLYFEKWVWITSSGAPAHMPAMATAATRNGHSNIMASAQSNEVTFAQTINICAMEKTIALNESQASLHLYAEILPAMATYKRASWKIVSGEEFATIDDNGLLIANTDGKNGTLRVRATAIDGSGIYAEKDIVVSGMSKEILTESITLHSTSGVTIFTNSTTTITIAATITPSTATNHNLSWDILSGADKVKMETNGDSCTLSLKEGAENGEVLLSATAQDGSGVYGTITLSVDREAIPVYYTIRFLDWDGTILHNVLVQENTFPTFIGTPFKSEDQQYTYTFTGWLPEIEVATKNQDYYAQYTAVLRTFSVTFMDWDGSIIATQEIEYGSAATAPAEPVREGYMFTGWDKDFSHITENIFVTAQYEKIDVYYTILFLNWDGAELQNSQVKEGDMPAYTGATPVKPEDEQYTYSFSGWSPAIVAATANADYTAQFTATEKQPGTPITVRLYSCEWETVYLFAWTGSGETQPCGAWPGAAVSKDAQGWWSYTFDPSIWDVNIIWNNGSGLQTKDIEGVTASTCYRLDESIYPLGATVIDCNTPIRNTEAIEDIRTDVSDAPYKVMIDNILYILMPDGAIYNAQGARVK